MGGVECIIGGVHRHVVYEVVSYYDKKYIEKWFLHDESANLLALKTESISIKEHYTRLYGPLVTISKTDSWTSPTGGPVSRARVQTYAPKDGEADENMLAIAMRENEDSKLLKTAFESHPYSVYANKVQQPDYVHADSPVALEDCVKDQQKRTTVLWDKAFSEGKRISIEKRKSTTMKNVELGDVDENEEEVETIIEVYKEAKLKSQISRDLSSETSTVPKDV